MDFLRHGLHVINSFFSHFNLFENIESWLSFKLITYVCSILMQLVVRPAFLISIALFVMHSRQLNCQLPFVWSTSMCNQPTCDAYRKCSRKVSGKTWNFGGRCSIHITRFLFIERRKTDGHFNDDTNPWLVTAIDFN